jgi:hypothetical protein
MIFEEEKIASNPFSDYGNDAMILREESECNFDDISFKFKSGSRQETKRDMKVEETQSFKAIMRQRSQRV